MPDPITIRLNEKKTQALEDLQKKLNYETRTDLLNDIFDLFLTIPIDDIRNAKDRGFESTELKIREKCEEIILETEHICKCLDIASSKHQCNLAKKILPLYRLPCFQAYAEAGYETQLKIINGDIPCKVDCVFKTEEGQKFCACAFFFADMIIFNGEHEKVSKTSPKLAEKPQLAKSP